MAIADAVEGSWRCFANSKASGIYYAGIVFTRCCPGHDCPGRVWTEPYGPFATCAHKHAGRWEAIDCAKNLVALFLALCLRTTPSTPRSVP